MSGRSAMVTVPLSSCMTSVFSGSAWAKAGAAKSNWAAVSAAASFAISIRGRPAPGWIRPTSAGEPLFDTLRHYRGHEGRDVAAHRGDLADKRGGDVAGPRGRRNENRLQPGRHRAVCAGHLHLVVEVGAVAQPADQDRRIDLSREVDIEVVEG